MRSLNYPYLFKRLTKNLDKRLKEVISRRFGIEKKERETLDSIGKDFGVTRERIRQLQERAFNLIERENSSLLAQVFEDYRRYFRNQGGFKKEDLALSDLGGARYQGYTLFLLHLGPSFFKFYEKREHFPFWAIEGKDYKEIQRYLKNLKRLFERKGEPVRFRELLNLASFSKRISFLRSLVEVSKEIFETEEGFLGLKNWPQINPRGVRDKAYLVLKKENRPLHFREIASLIKPKALVATVHNELIRDERFILIGRGTYALSEWGFKPGTVKEIIVEILKEAKRALPKEEILKKVLSQRLVKDSTILSSLNDRTLFKRDKEGRYKLA